MDEKILLRILTLIQTLHLAVGVFFHEPSNVLIQPFVEENSTDFGFTMTYSATPKNHLVVGAPRVDLFGKVYSCEMEDADVKPIINCDENSIDFDTVEYSRERFPEQNFYMGSSIVATDDFIFSCGPLRTTDVTSIGGKLLWDALGTCFAHNSSGTFQYTGTFEQFQKRPFSDLNAIVGGTGFSVLGDENNDILLIIKTSLQGDITYTTLSNPLKETKSLILKNRDAREMFPRYVNIGYGITAGKFFSNETVYAFSLEDFNMAGYIWFLHYTPKYGSLSFMKKLRTIYKIKSHCIGTMFGTTMGAADFNMDGLDELLVGAPAQTEDECVECGAVHIYIGGDIATIGEDRNRMRTIFGDGDFGRFGTAIATKDVDGDSIPELVVSAPYENEGHGAVYILSGFELYHNLMKSSFHKNVLVSELQLTQRIQKEPYRTLGYSLQFVDDTDNNGCSELAAGSPDNGTVLLFKCLQNINLTLFSELIGKQVREQDESFTIKVCIQVRLPALPYDIIGNVSVVNSIIGEATDIPEPKFTIDISCYGCPKYREFCENVTVNLNDKEPHDYTFISRAELHNDIMKNNTAFNETWVVTGPYSNLMKSIEVSRHCTGNDCIPKLSMEVLWNGSSEVYELGSSPSEMAYIQVRNDGNASYDACVWLRVSGAPLTRIDCEGYDEGYRCFLPKPLKRESKYSINLILDMTKPNDIDTKLRVEAKLYGNCNQKDVTNSSSLEVEYTFPTSGINITGLSHSRSISEKQASTSDTIDDNSEYIITNNGNITWNHVHAIIKMEKKPFIKKFYMSQTDSRKCKEINMPDNFAYKCILYLTSNTTQKITATTTIFFSYFIGSHLKHDEALNTTSQLTLYLEKAAQTITSEVTTELVFQKETSLGNNQLLISLIALLVALLILAIIMFILYKRGFFRRKQKQRLEVMRRESIKRKNSRRTTYVSDVKDSPSEGLQMEIVDDSPFDEIPTPVTTRDNASLVDK